MSVQVFGTVPYTVTAPMTYCTKQDATAGGKQGDPRMNDRRLQVQPPWRGSAEILVQAVSASANTLVYLGPTEATCDLIESGGFPIGRLLGFLFDIVTPGPGGISPTWAEVPDGTPWFFTTSAAGGVAAFVVVIWRRPLLDMGRWTSVGPRSQAAAEGILAYEQQHSEETDECSNTDHPKLPMPWNNPRGRQLTPVGTQQASESVKANQLAPGVPNLRRTVLRGGVPRSGRRG